MRNSINPFPRALQSPKLPKANLLMLFFGCKIVQHFQPYHLNQCRIYSTPLNYMKHFKGQFEINYLTISVLHYQFYNAKSLAHKRSLSFGG